MDKRVRFDFEIDFTNGGGIRGEDFRLDIAGDTISDKELADYIVEDMRLLMVGQTRILNKEILTEPHKRKPISTGQTGRRFIDLSHVIDNGLVTYKGLPAPIICDYLSREDSAKIYEAGTSFQIGKIEMVTNTGTYIDCPFHRYAHGKDLSEVGLEAFADLDGIVVRVPHTTTLAITADHFRGLEIRNRAVLVHTGWDRHWNTEQYYENHPFLTRDAAEYLKDCQVKLVGIDSHNIDDTREPLPPAPSTAQPPLNPEKPGKSRPVHSILLGAEILIVEHLTHLELLPDQDFLFSAVPPKFKGAGTFPVRAMAKIGG